VTTTPSDTHEVHSGGKNAITPAEAFFAIKTPKVAGYDEIRPEILKALNQGVHWLTRACHVTWCYGRAPKDWQTGVIVPTHKKGDRSECTNYRDISLLSLQEKRMPSAL